MIDYLIIGLEIIYWPLFFIWLFTLIICLITKIMIKITT